MASTRYISATVDDNAPTQTIRTGLGKILSVTDTEKSYKLMETPKVPADVWAALKESERRLRVLQELTNSLFKGSSAGPVQEWVVLLRVPTSSRVQVLHDSTARWTTSSNKFSNRS
jgi:hypothetical protein